MTRTLYIDMLDGSPGPKRGDYIQAMGKRGPGTRYLVLISRQVKRRDPNTPPRYTMVVDDASVAHRRRSGAREIELHWYPRKKRTFEQHMRRNAQ